MKTLHVALICATTLASGIIISQPKPVPSPVKYEEVLDMAQPQPILLDDASLSESVPVYVSSRQRSISSERTSDRLSRAMHRTDMVLEQLRWSQVYFPMEITVQHEFPYHLFPYHLNY